MTDCIASGPRAAKSPPSSCLDPTLLAPSGLSRSHPVSLSTTPWCFNWTGRLPLEVGAGGGGVASGLRSLSGLRPPMCP